MTPPRKIATKRSAARPVENVVAPAARRLAKARARNDLLAPSRDEILAFQESFLRRSGLLVFTKDPAVIRAALPKKPEPAERVASFMARVFGSKDADVTFAQFVSLDGRSSMHSIVCNNAGHKLKRILKSAGRLALEAVEETHAEEISSVKARMKALRERTRRQQVEDRKRLEQYPAEWLDDRANEVQDLNDGAAGIAVRDPRVIERLRIIAREAREQAGGDGTAGTPLEFVVDKLIDAYDAMARHEKCHADELKQLRKKLDGLH